MFTLDGSEEQLRKSVLEKRKGFSAEMKRIKEERRLLKMEKASLPTNRADTLHKHHDLEKQISRLTSELFNIEREYRAVGMPVTRVLPVKLATPTVDGDTVVHNWVLIKQFMKKLNGYALDVVVLKGGVLNIQYKKGLSQGELILVPLCFESDLRVSGIELPSLVIQN